MYKDLLFYKSGFDILCMVILFLAMASLTVYLFQQFTQWQRNRTAPRLNVDADVVSKRSDCDDNAFDRPVSGDYYVTFEMEGGDRMELKLPGREFLRIAEGDFGRLTFQGSRYIAFVPENTAA